MGLQPTIFCRWQKEFFENGAGRLRAERPAEPFRRAGTDAYLEKKIRTKDEVLAEPMAEHVALKKGIGEL